MSQCKKCGGSVPDNATTCPVCGSAVEPKPAASSAADSPGGMQSSVVAQPKKKSPLKIIAIVVAVLFVLSAFSQCANGCKGSASQENWPTGTLAQMLPSMEVKCKSVYENDDSVFITVSEGINKDRYTAYLAKCKERGFTVESNEDANEYEAYDADGYKLTLRLNSKGDELDIKLDSSKTSGSLIWPTGGPATLLPNPGKDKGSISIDSSSQFYAYVGDVSQTEYHSYVDKCIEQGFNVNYSKGDQTFSAEDASGNSLHLEYQGFNTMNISLYAAKEPPASTSDVATENTGIDSATEITSDATASDASASQQGTEQTDVDFKQTMDAYERFMDEYIAFMMKYQDSGQPASMALDYAKMVASYADWTTKLSGLDETSLTESDLAYYSEVNIRVAQKLSDAAIAM